MIRDPYRYLTEQHVEGPAERKYIYTLYATYKQGIIGFLAIGLFLYYYQMFILQEFTFLSFTILKYTIYVLETAHNAITKIVADNNIFENGFNIFLDSYSYQSNAHTFSVATYPFVSKDIYFNFANREFYLICANLYDSTIEFFFGFMKSLLLYESLVSDEGYFFSMIPGTIPHYLNTDYISNQDVLDLFKFNSFALQYEQEYLIEALIRYTIYVVDISEGVTLHGRLCGIIPDSLVNVLLHQSAYLSLYRYYLPIFTSLFPEFVDNSDSYILLDLAFSSFKDCLNFFIDMLFFTFSFYINVVSNIFSYNSDYLNNSYFFIKSPNKLFSSTDFYVDLYSIEDYYIEEKSTMFSRHVENLRFLTVRDHYMPMIFTYQSAYVYGWFTYFKYSDFFEHERIYDLYKYNNVPYEFQYKLDTMDYLTEIRLDDNLTQFLLLSFCQFGLAAALDDFKILDNIVLASPLKTAFYPSQFKEIELEDVAWLKKKHVFLDVGSMYFQYPLHPHFIDYSLEGQDKLTFAFTTSQMLREDFHEKFDNTAAVDMTNSLEMAKKVKEVYKTSFDRDIKLANKDFPLLQEVTQEQFGIILNPKWLDSINFLKFLVRDEWSSKINQTTMFKPKYLTSNILNTLCFKSLHSNEYIPFLSTKNSTNYYSLISNQNSFSNSKCYNSFTEFFIGVQEKDFDQLKSICLSKIRTFYDFDFYKILNTSYLIVLFFIIQKIYRHSIKSIKEILIDYVHYNHTIVFDFIELTLKLLYIKLIFVTLYYLYFFGNTFLFLTEFGSYLNFF